MSQLLEVNEYDYVQTLGVSEFVQIGTVKIVPENVVKVHWELEIGDRTRFRVHMADGRTFITNWEGTEDIENWSAPIQNNN
jgi:asparagine N-glycosylation enzyme membrane subunit Stt3